jgi:chromosome segregation ATPase
MIFFWLALVALVFGTLGFLAHAFYFDQKERVATLEKEIESMTRVLARRDLAKIEAEQEAAEANGRIGLLELMLTEGSEERSALQARAREYEDEIRKLREAAAENQRSVVPTAEQKSVPLEISAPVQAEAAGSDQKVPLWKDHLTHILNLLDKIERERES